MSTRARWYLSLATGILSGRGPARPLVGFDSVDIGHAQGARGDQNAAAHDRLAASDLARLGAMHLGDLAIAEGGGYRAVDTILGGLQRLSHATARRKMIIMTIEPADRRQ